MLLYPVSECDRLGFGGELVDRKRMGKFQSKIDADQSHGETKKHHVDCTLGITYVKVPTLQLD